jgi:hypothetical protein
VSKGDELVTEAHVILSQGVVDSMPQVDRSSARLTSEVEARNQEKATILVGGRIVNYNLAPVLLYHTLFSEARKATMVSIITMYYSRLQRLSLGDAVCRT